MNHTYVTYPGYTIHIPDGLIKDFKTLSLLLQHIEFNSVIDLMENEVCCELLTKCSCATMAAIGQNYAHDLTVGTALDAWMSVSFLEQAVELLKAAQMTNPLRCDHLFSISPDFDKE